MADSRPVYTLKYDTRQERWYYEAGGEKHIYKNGQDIEILKDGEWLTGCVESESGKHYFFVPDDEEGDYFDLKEELSVR